MAQLNPHGRWYHCRWPLLRGRPTRQLPDCGDEPKCDGRRADAGGASDEKTISFTASRDDRDGKNLAGMRSTLWSKAGEAFRVKRGMDCDCKWCRASGSRRCGPLFESHRGQWRRRRGNEILIETFANATRKEDGPGKHFKTPGFARLLLFLLFICMCVYGSAILSSSGLAMAVAIRARSCQIFLEVRF